MTMRNYSARPDRFQNRRFGKLTTLIQVTRRVAQQKTIADVFPFFLKKKKKTRDSKMPKLKVPEEQDEIDIANSKSLHDFRRDFWPAP
jgi:hypothetical protein